jgi:hypothetical protein
MDGKNRAGCAVVTIEARGMPMRGDDARGSRPSANEPLQKVF